MDKNLDFPEQPRVMTNGEGELYFASMLRKIASFQPDEIIAVNRSGFSYAMWVAQELKLPLGSYWPKSKRFISDNPDSKRIVFVDDNVLQGSTYLETKVVMQHYLYEWKWAVLFSDWHTPEHIRNEIIQGTRLPYFAEEPMWGSRKISQNYGVRYRDE